MPSVQVCEAACMHLLSKVGIVKLWGSGRGKGKRGIGSAGAPSSLKPVAGEGRGKFNLGNSFLKGMRF